jgi:hypothetical protein
VARPAAWGLAAGYPAILAVLVIALFDVRAHRRSDGKFGVNQWGYRGSLMATPHPGVQIAIVGGSAAFAARTAWPDTMPAQLVSDLNARLEWTKQGGPFASVANLAEPGAGATTYVATLRDYAYLHPDFVCIYDGYDNESSPGTLGRHRSIVFRLTGYLPRSPALLLRGPDSVTEAEPAPTPLPPSTDISCGGSSAAYCSAMVETVRAGLQQGSDVVVAIPPYVSSPHETQQRSLAEALTREFGREARFHYVDLGRAIDLHDVSQSPDGLHPTPAGFRAIATRLSAAMLDPIHARVQRIQ